MAQTLKDFNPKTVTIGNQTWMAENLVIDDGGDGIYYNKTNKQYYYSWDAAMRVAKSIPGWHLPTAEEWNAAAEVCGAKVVGNDFKNNPYRRDYDGTKKLYNTLKVRLTGFYDGSGLSDVGLYAYCWDAAEDDSYFAYGRAFDTYGAMYASANFKDYRFSVRLVQDI